MIKAFLGLSSLHRAFSHLQGVLEETIGTPICMANCGLCCQDNTPTCMIIEACNMVSSLLGRDLSRALQAAEHWLLEKDPRITIYRGLPVGLLPRDLLMERGKVSKGRCPFLTDDLRCLIHSCRPLLCMAYGVTRDVMVDPGLGGCPRPLGRGETSTRQAVMTSGKIAPLVREFKDRCEKRKPEWVIRGFVPTLLFRAAEPDKFRAYVDDNRIASAKIIGTAFDASLMWQPQLDALRHGAAPDLVAYAYSTADPESLLAGVR